MLRDQSQSKAFDRTVVERAAAARGLWPDRPDHGRGDAPRPGSRRRGWPIAGGQGGGRSDRSPRTVEGVRGSLRPSRARTAWP